MLKSAQDMIAGKIGKQKAIEAQPVINYVIAIVAVVCALGFECGRRYERRQWRAEVESKNKTIAMLKRAPDEVQLLQYTVEHLRAMADRHGLSKSGRKEELAMRVAKQLAMVDKASP